MFRTSTLAASLFALTALVIGCSEPTKTAKNDPKKTVEKKGEDHSGFWCAEHGIPEKDCSLCLPEAEVQKRFKDKGDWCKLHDRAQSQCFKCDPTLYEKVFEPKYVAHFGKKPERPDKSEFEK